MADEGATVEVMQAVREGPVATLWLNRPERLNMNQSVDAAFALNSFAVLLSRGAHDSAEGSAAFKDKRRPEFKGD